MKNIEIIFKELDQLFDDNKIIEAEEYLLECVEDAKRENEDLVLLQIYNELLGYYRQTSQKEKLLDVVSRLLELVDRLGIRGQVSYATTSLNIANALRAIGDYGNSLKYFEETVRIYTENIPPSDMRMAGLLNNMSLLFQERGDFDNAREMLLKALDICRINEAGFEIAVTYANLANTSIMSNDYDDARIFAEEAIKIFKERNCIDAHYCSAVSALGLCLFNDGNKVEAGKMFLEAMKIVEESFGKNAQYMRLKENYEMCIDEPQKEDKNFDKGLDICRRYFEAYGLKMINERFPSYKDKMAAGMVGKGSDCFGYDDETSRDHDWGPGFCIWLEDDIYEKIGDELSKAYSELPAEFEGYKRINAFGHKRVGVFKISDFYKSLTGSASYEDIVWEDTEEASLAAAVNGEVYFDGPGVFTDYRIKLMAGYPEKIKYLKIAENAARFSQSGQYNYARVLKRGDRFTADKMLVDCVYDAMRLSHRIANVYAPHDKWLYKSFLSLNISKEVKSLVTNLFGALRLDDGQALEQTVKYTEELGEAFAVILYNMNYISDINPYLDFHSAELVEKSEYVSLSIDELCNRIVRLEFNAFDKVQNEGGRAYCQNDYPTFYVMRKSQYLTWDKDMLIQYLYDFNREFRIGHNLITEKYGRMMESTAPDKYEEIKDNFPYISPEKKAIIEQIVAVQMSMADEFAIEYPKTAGNARSFHTSEDNMGNTSYETYLRGEISTYSDKMLQLYGKYVIGYANSGQNIAKATIENTARLYGFENLDDFEAES